MTRTYAITLILFLLLFSGGCRRNDAQPEEHPEAIEKARTLLMEGRIPEADSITENFIALAVERGDSSLWAYGMLQKGINSYYRGDAGKLLEQSDSAMMWLRRQKTSPRNEELLSKACQIHGSYYDQYQFNRDSTCLYLRLAVEHAEKAGNPRALPQAYANYANTLRMASFLDSAAVYYQRAVFVADSLNLPKSEYIPLYNGLAAVFTDMHDFDNSRILWEKSESLLPEMGPFDRFNTLTGSGNELYYRGEYRQAADLFNDMKDWLDSVPGMEWERKFTAVNVADAELRTGNTRNASRLLREAEKFFTDVQHNDMVLSHIHSLRIRAALAEGDYTLASQLAGVHPAADSLRLEQLLGRLEVLEDLSAAKNDMDVAYAIHNRRDHLLDSLRSFRMRQQISSLNAIYNRDRRILALERGNSEKETRIYRLTTYIAIIAALGLALLFYLFTRRNKRHKREQKMMAKIIDLRKESLRNRVTPHFIYNALNRELNNTQKGNPSHMDALVRLIRRQQFAASEITVTLGAELDFVNDYITVSGGTPEYGVEYKLAIEPGIDPPTIPFPSMALQILVENAFKHGFRSLPAGETGILEIRIYKTGSGDTAVEVDNNRGPGCVSPRESGTGLRVLMESIRLFNEINKTKLTFTIDTDTTAGGRSGCRAVITIPGA